MCCFLWYHNIKKSQSEELGVGLKLVLCEELVCCWQSVSILLKIVNDIVKDFTIVLMGIPFTVISDRGNNHVLDCLMKVWVLHGLGFGLLNMGFRDSGEDYSWCCGSIAHEYILPHFRKNVNTKMLKKCTFFLFC